MSVDLCTESNEKYFLTVRHESGEMQIKYILKVNSQISRIRI